MTATVAEPVSVEQLAARVGITRAAIRYHCRDRRGRLFGIAYRRGRDWWIPADAADAFVANRKATAPDPHTDPAPADSRERNRRES